MDHETQECNDLLLQWGALFSAPSLRLGALRVVVVVHWGERSSRIPFKKVDIASFGRNNDVHCDWPSHWVTIRFGF